LEIAEANIVRLQMAARIVFHDGDLVAGLPESSFDFVVSNPPYVGESEKDDVQLRFEIEPRMPCLPDPLV
jgi:ribosomal protein L3 glutamine methyltransferase